MTTSIDRARRELDGLRGFIRRPGLTGWVKDRSARDNYQRAFAAIVEVEDTLGVEHPQTIKLSERLMALRDEARQAGLLSNSELLKAERKALGLG